MTDELDIELDRAKEMVDALRSSVSDVAWDLGAERRQAHIADMMAATGKFLAEDTDYVYEAIDKAEDEIMRLRGKVEEMESKNQSLEGQLEDLNSELERTRMELEVLKSA